MLDERLSVGGVIGDEPGVDVGVDQIEEEARGDDGNGDPLAAGSGSIGEDEGSVQVVGLPHGEKDQRDPLP